MRKHKRADLVFHVWPTNSCYIRLQERRPPEVTIDYFNGTWTYQDKTYKIGDTKLSPYGSREGTPYAVYDRTKMGHLQAMVRAERWVADRNGPAMSVD